MRVTGELEAAGTRLPLTFDAVVHELGDELEVEAIATADHRELG